MWRTKKLWPIHTQGGKQQPIENVSKEVLTLDLSEKKSDLNQLLYVQIKEAMYK